jgi:hypothetical protein
LVDQIRPVRYRAAAGDEVPIWVDRRQTMPARAEPALPLL